MDSSAHRLEHGVERWGRTRSSDTLNAQLRRVDTVHEGSEGAGKWRDEIMKISGRHDVEGGLEAGSDVYVPLGTVSQKKDFLQSPSPILKTTYQSSCALPPPLALLCPPLWLPSPPQPQPRCP